MSWTQRTAPGTDQANGRLTGRSLLRSGLRQLILGGSLSRQHPRLVLGDHHHLLAVR